MSRVDDNLALLRESAGATWVDPHFQFDRRTADAEILPSLLYDLTLEWVGDRGGGDVHLVLDEDGTVELDAVCGPPPTKELSWSGQPLVQGSGVTIVTWEGLFAVQASFQLVLQAWTKGELSTLFPKEHA